MSVSNHCETTHVADKTIEFVASPLQTLVGRLGGLIGRTDRVQGLSAVVVLALVLYVAASVLG